MDVWHAKMREAQRLSSIPFLTVSVDTLEAPSGCTAQISVSVSAAVENTKLLATDMPISKPSIEIWNKGAWLSGPSNTLGPRVTQAIDTIMKAFVNAWSESQKYLCTWEEWKAKTDRPSKE